MKDENERELDEKITLKGGMTVITKKKSDLTSTKEQSKLDVEKPKKEKIRIMRRMSKKPPPLS